MKVHIINHRCGDDEIEVKNGIRVFDWVGNEFIIMSIKEGEDIAKDHFDNIIAIELYR